MMDMGAMWIVVFVVTATVSGGSQVAISSTYLDGAMTGFDPFYMSSLKLSDQGRRSKIFQPLYTLQDSTNKEVLHSFVDEAHDENNFPDITVQKVVNFKQYLDFTTSSVFKLSSDSNLGAPILRYKSYSSSETKSHHLDQAMFQFFKDTGGEVLFAMTDTVTHTITISPFEIISFTPAFQSALVTLYEAAVNPISEIRHEIFSEFVKIYGTHFSRRTLLGSRAIFGILFSTRTENDKEERDRRRCVLEAAREALTPCMRGCNETTHTVFARASSKCGGEEHEAIVAVTGPLPERNLEDWGSAAKGSPNPIFYELEPLSKLFNADWFTQFYEDIQLHVNGTILSKYFVEQIADYTSRMASREGNKFPLRGCGLNSDCRHGTECRNESNTEGGFICVTIADATTTTTPAPTTTTTTTMRPVCPIGNGRLEAVEGQNKSITSHTSYGSSNYENSLSQHYIIVAPSRLRVRLKVQHFATEECCDHLIIYDGSTYSSSVLAVLSGIKSPPLPTYISSGCSVTLRFLADASTTYTGFNLLYDAVI